MAEFCDDKCFTAYRAVHHNDPDTVTTYHVRAEPPLGLFIIRTADDLRPFGPHRLFAMFQQACVATLARRLPRRA